MMSEINTNPSFAIPQRQHIAGLLIILVKQYRAAISSFFPFLIYVFVKEDPPVYVYYGLAAFLLLYTVFAIFKFLNIKYSIVNQEFIYKGGVLNKKKITIPFENIMNIDYEQNVVQQVLDVGKLKIETAGSNKEEIELYAITLDKIKEIRKIIFEEKAIIQKVDTTLDDGTTNEESVSSKRELIYQLSNINLLKSGLTANHLETGGIILALIFSFGQRLQDWKILGDYDEYEENIYNFVGTLKLFVLVIILFLIISVIVSIVRQLIVYFEFRFYRTSDGFYISRGLFNKKLLAVKDQKIQSIYYKQNILRRLIGMYDFHLQKIGDVKQVIHIPGMDIQTVDKTISILYPDFLQRDFTFHKISHYYFQRALLFTLIFTSIIASLLIWFELYLGLIPLMLLSSYLIINFYLKYKKFQFAIDDDYVVVNGGRFGTKKKIVPISKIQIVSTTDSPYQRNKGLRTIEIRDGGSVTRIPFVQEDLAKAMQEFLVYQIEVKE